MHVRVPMLKHLVRLFSRDNSAFIKRRWGGASIFPRPRRGGGERAEAKGCTHRK